MTGRSSARPRRSDTPLLRGIGQSRVLETLKIGAIRAPCYDHIATTACASCAAYLAATAGRQVITDGTTLRHRRNHLNIDGMMVLVTAHRDPEQTSSENISSVTPVYCIACRGKSGAAQRQPICRMHKEQCIGASAWYSGSTTARHKRRRQSWPVACGRKCFIQLRRRWADALGCLANNNATTRDHSRCLSADRATRGCAGSGKRMSLVE